MSRSAVDASAARPSHVRWLAALNRRARWHGVLTGLSVPVRAWGRVSGLEGVSAAPERDLEATVALATTRVAHRLGLDPALPRTAGWPTPDALRAIARDGGPSAMAVMTAIERELAALRAQDVICVNGRWVAWRSERRATVAGVLVLTGITASALGAAGVLVDVGRGWASVLLMQVPWAIAWAAHAVRSRRGRAGANERGRAGQ